MGRQGYPSEFRRRVLDLLAEGRTVASVAHNLDVSGQTIFNGDGKTASTEASSPA